MLAAMKSWAIALAVRSLVAVVFIFIVYGLMWVAARLIPEGRVKTFLFKRRG